MCGWSKPMRALNKGPTVVQAVRLSPFSRQAITLAGEVRKALRVTNVTRRGRTGTRTSITTMGTSARVVGDSRDEQEFRPFDIERLTEQLAQSEEQAVHQHVDGENPAALRVRRQRIQPTLDDDGKSRGIDADQKPQQRQRRHTVGKIKTQDGHGLQAGKGRVRPVQAHRRNHLVGVQATH